MSDTDNERPASPKRRPRKQGIERYKKRYRPTKAEENLPVKVKKSAKKQPKAKQPSAPKKPVAKKIVKAKKVNHNTAVIPSRAKADKIKPAAKKSVGRPAKMAEVAKPAQKKRKRKTPRKNTLAYAIYTSLMAGNSNNEVLAEIKTLIPDAKVTRLTIANYRSKFQKQGKKIPPSTRPKKYGLAAVKLPTPQKTPVAAKAAAPSKDKAAAPKHAKKSLIEALMPTLNTGMAIALASDHAGVEMKKALIAALKSQGIQTLDLGTNNEESVDYPDFANAVSQALAWGQASRGVLICGSGIGISIAANRHRHIRAALCVNGLMARMARQHNDANVLVLGARLIGIDVAKDCLTAFLNTKFEGGRHSRRVDKMS